MLIDLVRSKLKLRIPAVFPSSRPLFKAYCLVRGLVEKETCQGDLPLRVLILTIPLLISPYSTEGTPEITSTDSTFADERLRVLAPAVSLNTALLERRTPSTSTAVPKLAPDSPPVRISNRGDVVKLGLIVFPPGINAIKSETFTICM